jgi:eukaryotic-like serine/threonine-protein kinase
MHPEDPLAEIGTVLGGRYRLVELLGQGGMARIYRGHDQELDRDVAIKVLRPEYGRDPDFNSRFRQEAQNAASLNHPNIVAVYDYGQDEIGPFIVMELVDGEDLASILKRSGALPPRQAARIAAEVARALQAAHQRGIVHRDVKPGNVLINRDGQVKVTDFGIARAVAEAQMTLPGTTLGSVHYFSPEQARGEPATASSDIYSLGIVLYELLTGRRPWEADSAAAVAMARLAGPPPDPSAVRSGIPTDLVAIDRKAMATEPADRWSSAASMAAALEAFLAGGPVPEVGGQPATSAGDATIAGGGPAAAAAAGALGGAAGARASSATARANPAAIPYAPDAYADPTGRSAADPASRPIARSGDTGRRQARPYREEEDEQPEGTSPAVWIAGIVALLILVAVGFLVFRLLSGPSATPPVGQVTVPTFVNLALADAQALATRSGVQLNVAGMASASPGVAPNTVLTQDPAAGTKIDRDGTVTVTVAAGVETVAVPDLRNLSETDAFNALAGAGLSLGPKTEDFDPTIPAGFVVSQNPSPGVVVNKGTPVAYVLSKGPEPSPSPSPSPSPTPTPPPTPPPTPAPTPTPPPTPAPIVVGDYRCMTVGDAQTQIAADGFTSSVLPAGAADTWFVTGQTPAAGTSAPPNSTITLSADDTKPADCP